MKKLFTFLVAFFASIIVFSQVQDWTITNPNYDAQDVGVATYNALNHGVVANDANAVNPNTIAVQGLLDEIAKQGGGVLYFPAVGEETTIYYLLRISIPKGVSIRGDWKIPTDAKSVDGTVLACKWGQNSTSRNESFIIMEPSTSVTNLAIWYPDQDLNRVWPYPPSILFGKQGYWGNEYCHVRNVTFVNSYHAVLHNGNNGGGATNVHNVYGTILHRGLELDNVSEVCRWDYVRWSPTYWVNSGLPDAPTSTSAPYAEFMRNNAIGFVQKRNDWSYTSFVEAEGLKVGFHAVKSTYAENSNYPTPNGHNYGFIFKNCGTGVLCDDISSYGIMFTNVVTENCGKGLVVNSTDNAPVQVSNCTFDADTAVWLSRGARSRLMMYQTTVERGKVIVENSDFTSVNGDYNNAAPQIELFKDSRAVITGNRSSLGEVDVKNCSVYESHIDHTPIANAKTPPNFSWEDCFDVPTKPAKNDLRVITEAPYNARPFRVLPHGTYTLISNPYTDETPNTFSIADNSPANRRIIRQRYLEVMDAAQDATNIIQTAINDMATNGGGIVYLPAGHYKVLGTLNIKTGVELKGANDVGTHPMGIGTVLLASAGEGNANGTPFISMEPNSGIRGITIDYPNQNSFEAEDYKKVYPYTIRGNANTYIVNVALHACYQGVDLFTNKCDNHFIDYLAGQPFKNTVKVGNGTIGGRIYNIQTNLISYVSGNENKFGTWINSPLRDGGAETDRIKRAVSDYISEQHDFMILGDCSDQILYNNFGYLTHHGLWFANENGKGPSGKSLGQGVDAGIISLYYEKLGNGGFPLVSSQIVVVLNGSEPNRAKTAYIQTTSDFDGEADIFSSDYWGNPRMGIIAQGGTLNLYTAHSNAQLRNIKQEGNGIVNFYNSNIGNMSLASGSDASKVSASYSVVRLANGVNGVYNLDPTTKNPNPNPRIDDRTGWVAYASENDGDRAQQSINGISTNYWISTSRQNSSLWYYVNMQQKESFNIIYMSAGTGSNFIGRFNVLISNDGENWAEIATNVSGSRQMLLELPYTYEAQYIKIQSATASSAYWAIYDFGINCDCREAPEAPCVGDDCPCTGDDCPKSILNNYADNTQASVYYENGTLFIDGIEKYPAQTTIYNIAGQQIINKTTTCNIINIGNLNVGVYILTIKQNDKYFNGKFFVK